MCPVTGAVHFGHGLRWCLLDFSPGESVWFEVCGGVGRGILVKLNVRSNFGSHHIPVSPLPVLIQCTLPGSPFMVMFRVTSKSPLKAGLLSF